MRRVLEPPQSRQRTSPFQKVSLCLLPFSPPLTHRSWQPLICSVPIALSFLECYINGILLDVEFVSGFLMLFWLIHVDVFMSALFCFYCWVLVCSMNIIIVYLSVYHLGFFPHFFSFRNEAAINILVQFFCMFMYRSLCRHVSFLLVKCVGVIFLDHVANV